MTWIYSWSAYRLSVVTCRAVVLFDCLLYFIYKQLYICTLKHTISWRRICLHSLSLSCVTLLLCCRFSQAVAVVVAVGMFVCDWHNKMMCMSCKY